MKELHGKVAVVTGGASGIGRALAHRFAAEKMKLVLLDIEESALSAAADDLRAAGATVLAIRTDVARVADLQAAADQARAAFGTLHVICNNAGIAGVLGPLWTQSESDWEWTLSVNLWGVIHGIRIFLPPLLESGEEGHIVNTASMAGLTATPFMGAYTASKHAVVAISEVLAKELELSGSRVGVSVLCPGFVKTNIVASERNRPGRQRGDRIAQAGAPPQAGAPSGPGAGLMQAMPQLVGSGQPPDAIAEHVVKAIRESRFYVFTHPEMKPAIAHRMQDILEERAPGIDPLSRELAGRS